MNTLMIGHPLSGIHLNAPVDKSSSESVWDDSAISIRHRVIF